MRTALDPVAAIAAAAMAAAAAAQPAGPPRAVSPAARVAPFAPEWPVDEWFGLPPGKQRLRLADLAGKVVYLYCFQAWCPGCHSRGFPTLRKLVRRFGGRDEVAFVAVQTVFEGFETNTLERARGIARRYALDIPFGHDPGDGERGRGSRLMDAYQTRGTPYVIVIDKQRRIRFRDFHIGVDRAARLIAELAAAPAPNPLVGRAFGPLTPVRWIAGARPEGAVRTLYRWWTLDCPFCRDSLPALGELHERFGPRGLRVVAIYHRKGAQRPTDSELVDYARRRGFGGAVAVDPGWVALRDRLRRGKLSRATSVSFVVDADGIVRWVHEGPRLHRSPERRHPRADAAMRELEALLDAELPPAKAGAGR